MKRQDGRSTQGARSRPLGPLDRVFLLAESDRTMLHVAALLKFSPPENAPDGYLRALADEVRSEVAVMPPWNLKLAVPQLGPGPFQRWVPSEDIDLDYHVRRSSLPQPGDERELGTLISRLHGRQLDLTRPPWEMHLIEGFADGGFAMYVKMHHALIDGYTGMKLLRESLSKDQADKKSPILFATPPKMRRSPDGRTPAPRVSLSSRLLGTVTGVVADAQVLGIALMNVAPVRGRRELVGPFHAPSTMFNKRIGRNRRFATQQLDLDAIRTLGREHDASVNDVALSLLGGSLRRYLQELDQLPKKPLIAFLPVNTRPVGDAGGGNALGAILASLGTDIEDPLERLRAVTASTRAAKRQLEGMSQSAAIAYGAALLSPMLAQAAAGAIGVPLPGPFSFNVIVSNVPGPAEDRYFRGSRLEAMYPASVQLDGAALNVTLLGYADTLNFGFTGDRDAVPHLQRLATMLAEEWSALELRCESGQS